MTCLPLETHSHRVTFCTEDDASTWLRWQLHQKKTKAVCPPTVMLVVHPLFCNTALYPTLRPFWDHAFWAQAYEVLHPRWQARRQHFLAAYFFEVRSAVARRTSRVTDGVQPGMLVTSSSSFSSCSAASRSSSSAGLRAIRKLWKYSRASALPLMLMIATECGVVHVATAQHDSTSETKV